MESHEGLFHIAQPASLLSLLMDASLDFFPMFYSAKLEVMSDRNQLLTVGLFHLSSWWFQLEIFRK